MRSFSRFPRRGRHRLRHPATLGTNARHVSPEVIDAFGAEAVFKPHSAAVSFGDPVKHSATDDHRNKHREVGPQRGYRRRCVLKSPCCNRSDGEHCDEHCPKQPRATTRPPASTVDASPHVARHVLRNPGRKESCPSTHRGCDLIHLEVVAGTSSPHDGRDATQRRVAQIVALPSPRVVVYNGTR